MKHDIFEFNHIDNLLSEDEIKTIKEFYEYYHKKFWCFKKTFKHFKILDETINISGILLMIIGTISGGLTMNPIVLGVINGVDCLIYKYLFETYFRKNVSLDEIMTLIDITDFLFISNSPVLKNHLIFHYAFKTFWKRHKKGRPYVYVFDTTIRSSIRGFVTGFCIGFFMKV